MVRVRVRVRVGQRGLGLAELERHVGGGHARLEPAGEQVARVEELARQRRLARLVGGVRLVRLMGRGLESGSVVSSQGEGWVSGQWPVGGGSGLGLGEGRGSGEGQASWAACASCMSH